MTPAASSGFAFPPSPGNMQRSLVCGLFCFFPLRQILFPKVSSIPSHCLSPTEFLSCLEQVKAGQQGGGKVLWRELCCIMQGRAANLLLPPPFATPTPLDQEVQDPSSVCRDRGSGVVVEGKPLP